MGEPRRSQVLQEAQTIHVCHGIHSFGRKEEADTSHGENTHHVKAKTEFHGAVISRLQVNSACDFS